MEVTAQILDMMDDRICKNPNGIPIKLSHVMEDYGNATQMVECL